MGTEQRVENRANDTGSLFAPCFGNKQLMMQLCVAPRNGARYAIFMAGGISGETVVDGLDFDWT